MWLDELLQTGEHAERLRNDLAYFAEHALILRPKTGALTPFVFNEAQKRLHQALQEQKAQTGKVRAIVLKARQMGVSSYIAARLFHRTIFNPGLRTIIIAHTRVASGNLFEIVKRFFDNLPTDIKPSLGVSNAEALVFDRIDSGYLVTVAGDAGTGRSATAQCLHASESAFWSELPVQMAGLLQTVPRAPDTEILIESTAFGLNDFYQLWRKAESGHSEFKPIFLPWSLDRGYRQEVEADFRMDSEEQALAELHNLDAEQICWRRSKVNEAGAPEMFLAEYPLTSSEAFVASNFDSFIPAHLVIKARREEVEPHEGAPLILGVDPAYTGPDRTSIAWRRGRVITKVQSRRGLDTTETCGWVSRIIREDKPDRIFVDITGVGAGAYDRLRELGHGIVEGVHFSGKPVEPPPFDETGKPGGGPANRRAEMWLNVKKALEEGRFSLPDNDELQSDLVSVGYRYNSAGQLLLESKADLKKRGVPSPDTADAVALCFADPEGFVGRAKNFHREISYPKEWGYMA